MGFVDVFPDGSVELGYPLVSVAVGAATRWQALSDANDATYVKEDTGTYGIDIIGLADVTVPAGAVITGGELHIRMAHAIALGMTSFGVYAPPKPAYRSAYSPDWYAFALTPLGTDVGAWYYTSTADGTVHDVVIQYNPTFQYNNGFFGWDYLTWDKLDFTDFRILYSYDAYVAGTSGTRHLTRLFVRVFYDMPPTVSSIQPTDLSAGQTFTTTPTIKWTYSDTESTPQSQYRLKVFLAGTQDAAGVQAGTAGFNPDTAASTAFDSGIVSGPANQATVQPRGLTNLSSYWAYVKVWHTPVNGNEMKSAWTPGAASFQVNGTAPSVPSITVTADNTNQRNQIDVIQGSWTATPYPSYFNVLKVLNANTDTTEFVRGGVNQTRMTAIRTGSDAGNDIVTPDTSTLRLTGDKIFVACLAKEGAIPTNGHYIISKADGTFGTMYFFRITSGGFPEIQWWNGASLQTGTSAVAIPFPADKTPFWVKAQHVTASNWQAWFWYSLDPPETLPANVNWTLLNVFTGSGSGTTTSLNSTVEINRTSGTLASTMRIYLVEIRNAFNVVVANPDFRGATIGATTLTDSTGKVWTINRASTNQTFALLRLNDYEDAPSTSRTYRAQAVTVAAGSPVGSAYASASTSGYTTTTTYTWYFKVILVPTLNKTFSMLPGSWDAKRPAATAAFTPLGRANKVIVSDGVKGNEQTLAIETTSQTEYDNLRLIYEAQQVVLVQATGQQRYFFFTDWDEDRGTLATGYSIVKLSAIEVDRPLIS